MNVDAPAGWTSWRVGLAADLTCCPSSRKNDGGLSKSSPQRTGLPEQRGEVQHEPMIKPVKYYEE